MNLTNIVRPYFQRRIDATASWFNGYTEQIQRAELDRLLLMGRHTLWGVDHGFYKICSYEQFRDSQPLVSYEDIRPLVEKMISGTPDILWPGVTKRYAQSSGTSGGKSKYIPVTGDSLKWCHYRAGSDAVSRYLELYPDSRLFSGKSFILGGSYANELTGLPGGVHVGDLSASLIDCINPLANIMRIPAKGTALLPDWERKLPALVEAGISADVTNIAGVPSWMLTVLKQMMAKKGVDDIREIWPNLEVFFHGGIAFGPYRDEYASLTKGEPMRYLETYNASEGFFGVQDRAGIPGMLLMLDCGIFYEFIPEEGGDPVPAWKVTPGKVYEMVISACNGLWRYRIGDTVRVETVNPLRITVAGRTKAFINAFGEEVMVYNADRAIETACRATGATVADYTAAPVYAAGKSHGRHQWLVEFNRRPDSMELFARILDESLRNENSDYDAKRNKNIFLDAPEVIEARTGLFDSWLAATGKRGGQRKVPRLSNNRTLMDRLLEFESEAVTA